MNRCSYRRPRVHTLVYFIFLVTFNTLHAQESSGIVSGEISRDLFKAVKTIYPTRRVEIIKSKVEQVAALVSTK